MTTNAQNAGNRDYPELRVRLNLRGHGFDPQEITDALGLDPTRTWRAGVRTDPKRNPPTVDGWMLQIGPTVSIDFTDQIDELLRRLRPLASRVRALSDRLHFSTEISCVAYVEYVVPALYFTPDQLNIVQALGAAIDVDFMLVAENDE